MPLGRQRGAAPRVGDGAMSSRLYAGKAENSPLLAAHGSVTVLLYSVPRGRSDNVRDAEDQQERLLYHGWIVGFVDDEGCFSCPIYRNRVTTLGWQGYNQTSWLCSQPAVVTSSRRCAASSDAARSTSIVSNDDNREDLSRYVVV